MGRREITKRSFESAISSGMTKEKKKAKLDIGNQEKIEGNREEIEM